MPLTIKTTGLEQYAPGGGAALKMLIVGGPSAGKTRMSSFWPKPIYADCEGGLASVADRKVPFATINRSQDMLDFLNFMKLECRRPYADRQYQTVVIDTLDAFQRKLKEEWLAANPGAPAFRGFEAWGFLETKMQMLLTRLLNLDCNIIVAAHPKDKTIKEGTGDNAVERQELMLQLQGDVKDTVFADFDLVGYMGTFWDVEDGVRVEKRGLTFKKTPEKPFLKDRLHIMPPWMEVTFSDSDYANLFGAFTARMDDLVGSVEVGEIPTETGEEPPRDWEPPRVGSGPVTPLGPQEMPLSQLDKQSLQNLARDMGLRFKGNDVKSELIKLIESARAGSIEAVPASDALEETAQPQVTQSEQPAAEPPAPSPAATEPAAPTDISALVEIPDTPDPVEQASDTVQYALGGKVLYDTGATDEAPMASPEPPAAVPPPASNAAACQRCGVDTSAMNQDYVKIGKIKFRLLLCNDDFAEAKANPNAAWISELRQKQTA
jgi:hypothetical protein